MIANWRLRLDHLTKRIWFRTFLFSAFGILTALLSAFLAPYVPPGLASEIGADSVESILAIIASSMLAVTTFSLSTMVAALAGATGNVTPRATRLLIEDRTTQNVLATFVGAFLYSLVGIIALNTGLYTEQGRSILFAVTMLVVVAIVGILLRWIDYLSTFGLVRETTQRVEETAADAMQTRRDFPYLGGNPLERPMARVAVHSDRIGYVENIDMGSLEDCASEGGVMIDVAALPGTFIDPSRPVAFISADLGAEAAERIAACFAIGDTRAFEQDPRFGVQVLTEIASRALSPALNDPGTAIDVIGRQVRVLSIWAKPDEQIEITYPNVSVPHVTIDELFDDAFGPIARDGCRMVEVQIRLQKALKSLAGLGDPRFVLAAERHAASALKRAEEGLQFSGDVERLRAAIA